jgi:hypothetical protein
MNTEALVVDAGLREMLVLFSKRDISDTEWASIRQSLRCLVSGQRLLEETIGGVLRRRLISTTIETMSLRDIIAYLGTKATTGKTVQEILLEAAIINKTP